MKFQLLQRLLCNALIQSHFDYSVSFWYFSLTKKKDKEMYGSLEIDFVYS